MTGTNRIGERLSSARSAGRCALLPYFTFGFPDQAATAELIVAADTVGASVIELGVPYSDSIADGVIIGSAIIHRIDDAVGAGANSKTIVAVVTEFLMELSIGLAPSASTR